MKHYIIGLLSACCWVGLTQANDNIQVSGFASVIGSQVLDGSGYVADYPNLGAYDDQLDLGQESKMGLQLSANVTEEMRATMQVMSRANNNYDPQVEWLFMNYAIRDDLELQAGRLRVPVYYYSEYMDVGYAYPWIRVPADAYSLDLTTFNGLQLNYRTNMGAVDISSALFTGRRQVNGDSELITGRQQANGDSELMSFLFNAQVQRSFTDLIGVGVEFSTDSTVAKITYSQADMEQLRSNSFDSADDGLTNEAISFIDVFVKQSFGDAEVMVEYNKYDPFYISYFVSGTYQVGAVKYYVMHSQFELDAQIGGVPIEEHDTNSVGLRYDFQPRVAFKLDISMINDTGVFAVNKDANNDGDAVILSTGVDFIF